MVRIVGAILIALVLFPRLHAQPTGFVGDHEVVLIPVYFFGPGAHGSNWETRVTVVGVGETSASMPVPMLGGPFDRDCGPPTGEIVPFLTKAICSGFASPSGLLLYIPKTLAPNDVQINVHVRDLNRNAESAGVQIPVARDKDFRMRDFLLTHIPSDARFRVNLRVFGGPETFSPDYRFIARGVPVGIEIYDAEDLSAPIVTTTLQLSDPEYVVGSSHPVRPAYASISDVTAAFPELRDVAAYTIRVIPYQSIVDPPRDFTNWAFVTLTNNETQEVTTITP